MTIKRVDSHKWLGCILEFSCHGHALEHHLLAATRAFHANKWILTDRRVSLSHRLQYFDKVVTPVACFASGRRAVYQGDLRKLDVLYRKLLRQVCGPPGNIDWSRPRHEVLHEWHMKVERVTSDTTMLPWSQVCLRQYWRLGTYVAALPTDRWLQRVWKWHPVGHRSQGRPREKWESAFVSFCQAHELGDWMLAAKDLQAWLSVTEDFITFAKS